jgi:hypothetical protein
MWSSVSAPPYALLIQIFVYIAVVGHNLKILTVTCFVSQRSQFAVNPTDPICTAVGWDPSPPRACARIDLHRKRSGSTGTSGWFISKCINFLLYGKALKLPAGQYGAQPFTFPLGLPRISHVESIESPSGSLTHRIFQRLSCQDYRSSACT